MIFLQNPSDSSAIKMSNIPMDHPRPNSLVLQEKFVELNGYGTNGGINADSVAIGGPFFLAYSRKIKKDTLDINHVVYDGKDFGITTIKKEGKGKKYSDQLSMDIVTNMPEKARSVYYGYVNKKIFGQLNDVFDYYRKL